MVMRILIATLLTASFISLGACSNTIEGVGRDIERAGEGIQKTF